MTDKSYQPTIAGLRAFVAVAEKQHFGSAATTLGVSQSTLSQALAALETGLGVQLVERSTRRVFLTTEGSALLPQAQAVIEAATAFTAAAAGSADPLQGTIRLGLIPTVAPYVLPTLLAGLAVRLPGLTLRVIEDQTERLLTGLREGSVDAALIALPAEASGMTDIAIYDEDFVLALPPGHPLSGKRGVSPAALAIAAARRGTLPAGSGAGPLPQGGRARRTGQHPGRVAGYCRAVRRRRTGRNADPAERGVRRERAQPAGTGPLRHTPARPSNRTGLPVVQRTRGTVSATRPFDRRAARRRPAGTAGEVATPTPPCRPK
jgi:DNA-binding transcriptional LysR family regulator